jgi:hypothetical protein
VQVALRAKESTVVLTLRVKVWDLEGWAVPGATVRAVGQGRTVEGVTDSQGWTALSVAPGEYSLSAAAPDFKPGQALTVRLTDRNEERQLSLPNAMARKAPLELTVRDEQGRPIAGAAVEARGMGGVGNDFRVTTSASGMVTVGLAREAWYFLIVSAPGYYFGSIQTRVPQMTRMAITLVRREEGADASTRPARFLVSVVDESGRPFAGARVDALTSDKRQVAETITGSSGTAMLSVPASVGRGGVRIRTRFAGFRDREAEAGEFRSFVQVATH